MDDALRPERVKPRRVFISYGHDRQQSIAVRIKADLVSRGHEVWFDEDRIKPGDDWEHSLEEGLNWARKDSNGCMLLLMTSHAVRRPDGYCLNEIALALQKYLRIVPVMLVWCEPPLSICRIQWLDMTDAVPPEEREERYQEKFARLTEAIERGTTDFEGFQSALINALQPLTYDAEIKHNLDHFTGRKWAFEAIDRWLASSPSRVFWIVGSPGVGKTALSARLCLQKREIAAFHFCRYDNVQKSDPRRCVMSLAYQLSTQLPDYQEQLKRLKLDGLGSLNAKTLFDLLIVQPLCSISRPDREVVLLIDALDEATALGQNELAGFIASEFERAPAWLKLIITSRPDPEVLGPLQAYSPFMFDVSDARNSADIRVYLRRELQRYAGGKPVSDAVLDAIAGKSSGLFLYAEWIVTELDRGRLSLDRLDAFPQGLGGIYLQYFERQFPDPARWEAEVRPVIEVMAALQEPPHLKLLSEVFGWSVHDTRRFRRSLGSLFQFDPERILPFHKSVLEWLTKDDKPDPYYISVEEGHRRLADYSWSQYKAGADVMNGYLLTYLPTHLCMAGRFKALEDLFGDLAFIRTAWGRDRFTLLQQWTLAEDRSPLRMARVYGHVLKGLAQENDRDLLVLVDLLNEMYHFGEAREILDYLIGRYRQSGDRQGLQRALGDQARIFRETGDLGKAMPLLEEQESICREIGDNDGLQAAIFLRADILASRNEVEAAMPLFKEQERICRMSGNMGGLLKCLAEQSFILRFRGDFDGALGLVEEQERIFSVTGNRMGLQRCLGERGVIYRSRGDLGRAWTCFNDQERSCRETGNKEQQIFALLARGTVLRWQGDLDGALALSREAELLARSIGSKYDLQDSMGERVSALRLKGDLDGALALTREWELICTELDNKFGLQACNGERGLILLARGDIDGALARFREQERVCREIGHRRDLAMCLDNQAVALRKKGDLTGALKLHDEAQLTLRALGYAYGLQESLGQTAITLIAKGDRDGAMSQLKEQEGICRRMDVKPDLEECLKNQKIIEK